jgi:hypothetical protein
MVFVRDFLATVIRISPEYCHAANACGVRAFFDSNLWTRQQAALWAHGQQSSDFCDFTNAERDVSSRKPQISIFLRVGVAFRSQWPFHDGKYAEWQV